jgi:hypothetical protein
MSLDIYRKMVIDGTGLDRQDNRHAAGDVVGSGTRGDFGAQYVAVVERILGRIGQSRTGEALFRSIEARTTTERQINIVPDLRRAPCAASHGRSIRGITVWYAPGAFGPGNSCTSWPGHDPTEALLHELVHAFRDLTGHLDLNRRLNYWTNTEELYAVTVTNTYSSESGRPLRSGHALPDPQFNSRAPDVAAFLRAFGAHLDRLIQENPDFCGRLAAIDVPFNPIRRRMRP